MKRAKVLSVSQGCHEIQVWQYTQKHFYIYKLLHKGYILLLIRFPGDSVVKSACQIHETQEMWFGPWVEDPGGNANHSSVLAGNPWTEAGEHILHGLESTQLGNWLLHTAV